MNLFRFVALMSAIGLAVVFVGAEETLIERLKKNHHQRLARLKDARASSLGGGAYASSSSSSDYVNGVPVNQQQQSVYESDESSLGGTGGPSSPSAPRASARARATSQASGQGSRAAAFASAQTAPVYRGPSEVRPIPAPVPRPSGSQATQMAAGAGVASSQPGVSSETNLSHSQAESFSESYVEPETDDVKTEVSGTYENDGDGFESESYQRMTEYDQEEEEGDEEDDHHYKASSKGKDLHENYNDKFHNANEDTTYGDGYVRLSKSTTSYDTNYNKKLRESGTEVSTRDRHRANFNRKKNKMMEMVDHNRHRSGAGSESSESSSTALEHEDEDGSEFDSNKIGQFKAPQMPIREAAKATSRAAAQAAGRPRAGAPGGPGSASASSAVTDAGLSTSAAVGQRAKTSASSKLRQ